MTNYKQLWDKIVKDLNNDDIVLEIKILNTDIQDWRNIFKILYEKYFNIIFDSNISVKLNEIDKLNINIFPQSDNDTMESLSLNFRHFNLTLSLYILEEIEFFSDSIITLNSNNMESLFSFCEIISLDLSKNMYIYCEGSDYPSIYYNPNNKLWSIREK